MVSNPESPVVERLEWGRVRTRVGAFRDAKLWPGGGRGWDWNETGTNHSPGVQVGDVIELLDRGSEIVVIGCGQHGRLQVTDEAIDLIEQRDAQPVILNSREAVDRYNGLIGDGVAVGALIHSTC